MVILNELPHVLQCFIHMKSHFLEKKNLVLPLGNFHLLYYPGTQKCYTTPYYQISALFISVK